MRFLGQRAPTARELINILKLLPPSTPINIFDHQGEPADLVLPGFDDEYGESVFTLKKGARSDIEVYNFDIRSTQ